MAIHFNLVKEVVGQQVYYGLCSSYLAHLTPQEVVVTSLENREEKERQVCFVSWEPAGEKFQLAEETADSPVLFVSAGTGFAPIRSFLQGM